MDWLLQIRNLQLNQTLGNSPNSDNFLQLSPIELNADYQKKWNVTMNDFVCLTINGELVNNSLYRVGGIGSPNLKKDNYFMLLKHVESYYEDSITIDPGKKPHLESRWCIIDKTGFEKMEFQNFKAPYLVKDSCIYSIDGKYFNIETGEFYCDSSNSMQSKDFLFLENRFDKDNAKRGVMKINKKSGIWELFP